MSRATLVYRGQFDLEASRVMFLMDAAADQFGPVDVVLLQPFEGRGRAVFESYAATSPAVRSSQVVAAPRASARKVRRHLEELLDRDHTLIAVGFSVTGFLPRRKCDVWCVNGIPEERLLSSTSPYSRLAVKWDWATARRSTADVAVVVSDPMARLIEHRLGLQTAVVPNAVDRELFHRPGGHTSRYLTYQGGGSPWQGLDRLADVWSELHRADADLRFRIISRDPRAHALANGLAPDVVDVTAADGHVEVCALLAEARLGFLYRPPCLVNEVSFPMKLGEYLACEVPVVASRCGWDVERVLSEHGAGLIVEWDDPPTATASRILEYLSEIESAGTQEVHAAAVALDRNSWSQEFGRALCAVERAQEQAL